MRVVMKVEGVRDEKEQTKQNRLKGEREEIEEEIER